MERRTNINILYEIAIDRLNTQIKTIDGIDNKIGITFGLANGITASLIAFVALITKPVPQLTLIFVILSFIAYVITLFLLFFAYKYERWSFNPHLKTLRDICTDPKYHDYPDIIKGWVADNCIISLELNRQPITMRLRRAYRALISISSQGLFLAASCIFYLLD